MFIAIALACGLSTSTVVPDCIVAAAKVPFSTREECTYVLTNMKDSLEGVKESGQVPDTAYILDARCVFIPEAV